MNSTTIEWNRLITWISEFACSFPARNKVLELLDSENWAKDCAQANALQQLTFEVMQLQDRMTVWKSMQELEDPEPLLLHLKKQGVLSLTEIRLLQRWLIALEVFCEINLDEIRGEHFKSMLKTLSHPSVFLRQIGKIITEDGELRENATSVLANLHSELRGLKRSIENKMGEILKDWHGRGLLQDQFTDFRDGRYVLPVRMGAQGEIEGIIHETSSSRQTAYIEPKEVTRLNNRLREVEAGIEEEIQRILKELSDSFRPEADSWRRELSTLITWDSFQARSEAAKIYGGKILKVVTDRKIKLEHTAHPLLFLTLPSEAVIRNTLELASPQSTLVISGPNTGGKTIFLKTLGMAALCARTGIPFPGVGELVVPFFDQVFADVGDPQSLEDSISSFSGHVLRFKEILETLSSSSLVLLDEMNSATDPEEGAALSRAFLETLMDAGAMAVVTTHDPHLKAFALNEPRILNASMAFDEVTKHPTYRLIPGIAGRSRALETAERLGLPLTILKKARSYLSETHVKLEDTLSRLEGDRTEAEKLRREASTLKLEAEKIKNEWEERASVQVSALMEKARVRIRRLQEDAQEQIRAVLRKMDEARSRKSVDEARQEVASVLKDVEVLSEEVLREEAPEVVHTFKLREQQKAKSVGMATDGTKDGPHEKSAESPGFKVGDKVRVPKWKTLGDILRIEKDQVKVAMGNLQVMVGLKDIEPLTTAQRKELGLGYGGKSRSSGLSDLLNRPAAPPSQIDLRGLRLDEAMRKLEPYLDLAYRSGSLREVNIVHGVGTGAIREKTREFLKSLPYVKDFRDGGFGGGGPGATIVEFDL